MEFMPTAIKTSKNINTNDEYITDNNENHLQYPARYPPKALTFDVRFPKLSLKFF